MPDQIFENPLLAMIYDHFDGDRKDLNHYLAIANELKAKSILDIGCGTGSFTSILSKNGFSVIGLEPAKASLDIARSKAYADKVRWVLGYVKDLPILKVDLAVMTGNVAQVFDTDSSWEETLKSIHKSLKPNGHLVFEVRDPARKAWGKWTKEQTYKSIDVPQIGRVEGWCEVVETSKEIVKFRWSYFFEKLNKKITSDSTLRFREREDINRTLKKAGYSILEIRDAPDRPNQEFVFICGLS